MKNSGSFNHFQDIPAKSFQENQYQDLQKRRNSSFMHRTRTSQGFRKKTSVESVASSQQNLPKDFLSQYAINPYFNDDSFQKKQVQQQRYSNNWKDHSYQDHSRRSIRVKKGLLQFRDRVGISGIMVVSSNQQQLQQQQSDEVNLSRQSLQSRQTKIEVQQPMNEQRMIMMNSRNQQDIFKSKSQQGKSANHLCSEILSKVLEMPEKNRPNRGLIKQMLVQQKLVNNLFSDQNLSFKKQQRINEIMKSRQMQQDPQMMFRQSNMFEHLKEARNIEFQFSKKYDVSRSTVLSTSQMNFNNNQTSYMWDVPDLNQNRIHDENPDNNTSILEVSKVDIKPSVTRSKPSTAQWGQRASIRSDLQHQYNSSAYQTLNNEQILNDNTQSKLAAVKNFQNQTSADLDIVFDQPIDPLDQQQQSHMTIMIPKAKSQNIFRRDNRSQEQVYSESKLSSIISKQMSIASDLSTQNNNINSNNSKVSVFKHLAANNKQQIPLSLKKKSGETSAYENYIFTLEANPQITIKDGSNDDVVVQNNGSKESDIQKEYQYIRQQAIKKLLIKSIQEQKQGKFGLVNSQRHILSRQNNLVHHHLLQTNSTHSDLKQQSQSQLLQKNESRAISNFREILSKSQLQQEFTTDNTQLLLEQDNENEILGHLTIEQSSSLKASLSYTNGSQRVPNKGLKDLQQ